VSPAPAKPRWRGVLTGLLKLAVGGLVLIAVGRQVAKTWRDLRAEDRTLTLEPSWMGLAALLYLLGLAACGVFFWWILRTSATPLGLPGALRAYLISHLGKYVPGKAMVVVLRAGLVVPFGARAATAAFATFYETLVMMASGGLIAAAGFAVSSTPVLRWPIGPRSALLVPPWALSLALGLAFLVIVEPRVFPRLSAWVSVPIPGVGPEALPRFSWSLLGVGLLLSALGWILLGMSQVAVVRALAPRGVAVSAWGLIVASVALATVAGFVIAIFPGGLGVRELVIMTTLAPAVGADLAVVAALALRLVWVIAEVLAAALVWLVRPPLHRMDLS
jgi:hypothetical protein